MPDTHYLYDVIIFLVATVLVVPLFERLKASPLVGYLLAGMVIGPSGLALVDDPKSVRNLAELGVVVLLFTVGLELPFNRLRVMGGAVFGLGMVQIGVIGAIFFFMAQWAGLDAAAGIVIGAALALSSTAVVLQLLVERRELSSRFGRSAIALLLLQDLSVGPILVLIPVLGQAEVSVWEALGIAGLKALLVLGVLVLVGRVVIKPLFKIAASAKASELNTALILLLIIATGMATHQAGLSMALGAFIAGMLLADTEYRSEVTKDIQPFRGLLLGLFFMSVGMFIDLQFAWDNLGKVCVLLVVLLGVKTIIIGGAARVQGFKTATSLRLGLILSQGGEFAFAFFSLAVGVGIVEGEIAQLLMIVVALSMAVTPLLAVVAAKTAHKLEPLTVPGLEALGAAAIGLEGHVVLFGYGEVGKTLAERLLAMNIPLLIIESDPRLVLEGQGINHPVFKANAMHPETLLAARIEEAQSVVISLGQATGPSQLIATLRYLFPNLKIIANARDEAHAKKLTKAGANETSVEIQNPGHRLAEKLIDR
ncbi:MAG: cation:proton antiporter [Alphaproteobacteria bacterium]|nr:cation:proton antiporter [Alphaproteobacteria bacterium]